MQSQERTHDDEQRTETSGGIQAAAAESERPETSLTDLSGAAANRIRRFLAESTVKGGASPADVADLYTSAEVVADERATAYLDRRHVHGEMPRDWRLLQDELTAAAYDAPRGLSGEALLVRVEAGQAAATRPRSIFDDPDDLDDEPEERGARLGDRDPTLADLTEDGRRDIESLVVADVLEYGVAPAVLMELRERFAGAGDERSLQYLDLPYERGERPADWDELRDRALLLRGRLESRGQDPSELFEKLEARQPWQTSLELLSMLEEEAARAR